ncbi:MAG: HIT domain-containing protein [Pirellulales bacterium]|nr:HIT domain-containing protein [Pirellulales bacterium]
MANERIWAPWRLSYVKGEATGDPPVELEAGQLLPGGVADCFLCCAAADDSKAGARARHIVQKTELAVCVLNRYPYNNGHLLVSPRRHVALLQDLTADETVELQRLLCGWVRIYEQHLNAEGFNIGLNLGSAAGAGVPGHLHWHIVPRWSGDTNFMPTVANIKVIPQSLDALWEFLRGIEWPEDN